MKSHMLKLQTSLNGSLMGIQKAKLVRQGGGICVSTNNKPKLAYTCYLIHTKS